MAAPGRLPERPRQELEEFEAQKYAEAIATVGVDWPAYNADIIARFSRTALLRIKKRAWQIVDARWWSVR